MLIALLGDGSDTLYLVTTAAKLAAPVFILTPYLGALLLGKRAVHARRASRMTSNPGAMPPWSAGRWRVARRSATSFLHLHCLPAVRAGHGGTALPHDAPLNPPPWHDPLQAVCFVLALLLLVATLYLLLLYRLKLRALRLLAGKYRDTTEQPFSLRRGGRLRGLLMRCLDASCAMRRQRVVPPRRLRSQLSFLTGRFAQQAYYWQCTPPPPEPSRKHRHHGR